MTVGVAVDRLLSTLLWLLLLAMTIVVATNVCCRFMLNDPLSWGDEVAQILLVWLTFLGAALAVRDDEHYYLNYLSRKASGPALRRVLLFRDVASLIAIGVLLYYSAIVSWQIRQWIMPATEISRALVYGACPVGCAFMLFYALDRFRRHLRGEDIDAPSDAMAATSTVTAKREASQ